MQQRVRTAGVVQLRSAFDNETTRFVEADRRRVLLVDVDHELAPEGTRVVDEASPTATTVELRRQKQRLHLCPRNPMKPITAPSAAHKTQNSVPFDAR